MTGSTTASPGLDGAVTTAPTSNQPVDNPHDQSASITTDDKVSSTSHDSTSLDQPRHAVDDSSSLAESLLPLKPFDASSDLAATPLLLDTQAALSPRILPGKSPTSAIANAGLHLRTNISPERPSSAGGARSHETPTILYEHSLSITDSLRQHTLSPNALKSMGSALRSNMSAASLASSLSPGPASGLPSPYLLHAITDLTPLPSPIVGSDAHRPWRRMKPGTPNRSRERSLDEPVSNTLATNPPTSPGSPSRKKKGYGNLMQEATIASAANAAAATFEMGADAQQRTRNRSISDFVPEQLQNTRQRHVTIGAGSTAAMEAIEYQMQREAYLAAERGIANSASMTENGKHLPTPPLSTSSHVGSDEMEDDGPFLEDGTVSEYLEIHCGIHNKRRKFRPLRQLGQGTFSTVMLATRERMPTHPTLEMEEALDRHKLVAVKIVAHGAAGGADEERIEISLMREVEMLKTVSHPSLIHLKACEYQPTRTLLVLTYCPGGDLFELASAHRDLLTPHMVRRIFAELVSAVCYLHSHWIVHRDIKLENVLVNLSPSDLRTITSPETHPTPIVTLTDLGLSRRIPDPPEPPLLLTRCGSEDYAAPEILLGQPYDGRLTDAWALGVLLYALVEGRLPFDAPPGRPDRSRNTHRIARCDWIWCRFGDEDGEWDPARPGAADFAGAQLCVDGLLKKVRMGRKPLDEIAAMEWVADAVQLPDGLKARTEDDDDDL